MQKSQADIKIGKQTEKALSFSDNKFQNVFQSSPIAIALINMEGKFVDLNQAALNLHGFQSKEEFLGKHFLTVVDDEYHHIASDKWLEVIDKGFENNVELALVKKDGRKIHVLLSATLLHGLSGKPEAVITMIVDISAYKKLESNLKESAEKYSVLFNNIYDGVWVCNTNCEILEVNDAYCRMSGYSQEELTAPMLISNLEVSETPEEIEQHIKKILKGVGNDRFESRHRRKDGSVFDLDITTLYMEKEGKRIVCFLRDITERKKMENLLQLKSKEQQIILDSTMAIIFFKDKNNRILLANKAFADFMGTTKDNLEGKTGFDILPGKQAEKFWKDDLEVMESGKAKRNIIVVIERPFGTRIMKADKVPYFDEEGNIKGVIVFAIDITEKKAMEARDKELNRIQASAEMERTKSLELEDAYNELKEMQDKLIRSERLAILGKLAGNIAHELRSPLGSIRNVSYLLSRELCHVEDVKVKKHLKILEKEVKAADTIINDVLTFGREQKPDLSEIDINSLIVTTIEKITMRENIKVVLKLQTKLPHAFASKVQIEHILINILTNAVQAMPHSGKLIVTSMLREGAVNVHIMDTGLGIEKENLEKIFEPLFSTKDKGIGLGLAICRSLLSANQGSIKVRSRPGKGSVFTLILPVA